MRHTVGFEETNLVGNVYYVNHLRWQGRCRELFLHQHAPEVLALVRTGLALATVRCACEFFAELEAFDEVVIRMRLGALAPARMTLLFEYWRIGAGGEELVARGEQEIACLRRDHSGARPMPWPPVLVAALEPFGAPGVRAGVVA